MDKQGNKKYIYGYELKECIGHGGMGQVWYAQDPQGYDVAFKLVHPTLLHNTTTLERMKREVSILSRLKHDCIATLLDYELEDEIPFIVTELIDGPTLDKYIKEYGPMNTNHTFKFASLLYETLQYLHSQSIVHRDLKPSNIIIADRPVLIDFGIAQDEYDSRITNTGLVSGTPGYLAPEIFAGKAPTAESDMWALAALTAFAMTGKNPFGHDSWTAVMSRVQKGQLCYTENDLPEEYLNLLRACLHPDPTLRLSFKYFLDSLENPQSLQTRVILDNNSGNTRLLKTNETEYAQIPQIVKETERTVSDNGIQEPKTSDFQTQIVDSVTSLSDDLQTQVERPTNDVPDFLRNSYIDSEENTGYFPSYHPARSNKPIEKDNSFEKDFTKQISPENTDTYREEFLSRNTESLNHYAENNAHYLDDNNMGMDGDELKPKKQVSKINIAIFTMLMAGLFTSIFYSNITYQNIDIRLIIVGAIFFLLSFIGVIRTDPLESKIYNFGVGLLKSPLYLLKALAITLLYVAMAYLSWQYVTPHFGEQHQIIQTYIVFLLSFIVFIFKSARRGMKKILLALDMNFLQTTFFYIIISAVIGIFVFVTF